jgi:probable rRNA maturation factor
MIFIEFDPDVKIDLPRELLESTAAAALRQQAAPDADLTLVLTGDARLRALNRDFLHLDAPTDVLSFPSEETDPETGRRYLGDVAISVLRAASQAQAGKHPFEQEVQLLVVHGVLHLLGHDHAGEDEKARMWTAQAAILESLGISPAIVHE